MRIDDNSTPAVILQMSTHGALAICRSLGRLGVEIYGIEKEPDATAFDSRYCTHRLHWDFDGRQNRESLDYLLDVGSKIARPAVLIPTADDGILFVAEHREELRQYFLFPEHDPELIRSLIDKRRMSELSKVMAIPNASTVFPRSLDDVETFAQTASYPVMLKGINVNVLQRRTGRRMMIVDNAKDLIANYLRMEDPSSPNLLIQEFIPGSDDAVWMFNGYFDRSARCLLGGTARKLRQTPPYQGSTSIGVCLENAAVRVQTVQMLEQLGYWGPVDVDLKFDRRDNSYKVLDVNPRIGSSFRLFSDQTGIDVVRTLYLDMTQQEIPAMSVPNGRKWFVEDDDFVSALQYRRDGRLSTKQWIESLRGIRESAYFCWDDSKPFVKVFLRFLLRSCNYLGKLFIREVRDILGRHPSAESQR